MIDSGMEMETRFFDSLEEAPPHWAPGTVSALLTTEHYRHNPGAESLAYLLSGQDGAEASGPGYERRLIHAYRKMVYSLVDESRGFFELFCIKPIRFPDLSPEVQATGILVFQEGRTDLERRPLIQIGFDGPLSRDMAFAPRQGILLYRKVPNDNHEDRTLWVDLHGEQSLN